MVIGGTAFAIRAEVWIELLRSVFLGLVQGLGEFLPISSSGHLVLFQRLFGVTQGGRLMTVLLHVGTLAAVCVECRSGLWALIKKPFQRKTLLLASATAATVLVVLTFGRFFRNSEDLRSVGLCFLLTAVLLEAGELAKRSVPQATCAHEMKLSRAALIGAMQGLAALPGVSRSGATLTAALLSGVDRKEAAEFSFLLSIPAILGGLALELPELLENGVVGPPWYALLAGMLAAAVSGCFAVRVMLRLVIGKSLRAFAVYTAALGALLLLGSLTKLF